MRLLPDLNEPEAPLPIDAESSLEFLQAVYSDPGQPMQRRMRAAIAALPFEHPKLAVTANIDGGPGFAARLEAAISKTAEMRGARVIEVSEQRR
ncbi:hypothetical protein [Methylocystis sp.]|uniref:hypothetical protein n=1 Tax=Methylocystis sp. TaxID=1911079 RepID=UPI0025EA03D0|nr:hypothetical protein [Methylocystis sp.]